MTPTDTETNRALHEEAEQIAAELHTSYLGALLIIAIRDSARSNTQLTALLNSVLESINDD